MSNFGIDSVFKHSEREFYKGDIINDLDTIFVFGSNPEGRHGAGAAKIAKNEFGAIYGQGEGLQNKSYALPTKDLRVKSNNGSKSISEDDIINSIKKLYTTANNNKGKKFKVAYRNTDARSLNGYTGLEMIKMFKSAGVIPSNIIFSEEWVKTGEFNNIRDYGKMGVTWFIDPKKGLRPPGFLRDENGDYVLNKEGKKIMKPGQVLLPVSIISKILPNYRDYNRG